MGVKLEIKKVRSTNYPINGSDLFICGGRSPKVSWDERESRRTRRKPVSGTYDGDPLNTRKKVFPVSRGVL